MSDTKRKPRMHDLPNSIRPEDWASPEKQLENQKRMYGSTTIRLVPRRPEKKPSPGVGSGTENLD